jgi:hypothetical protein
MCSVCTCDLKFAPAISHSTTSVSLETHEDDAEQTATEVFGVGLRIVFTGELKYAE